VIEIEAAQKILVGFALTAVLGGDQSRHHLEHFTDPRSRLLLDFLAGDYSLRGGIWREECAFRLRGHVEFRQSDRLAGILGSRRRCRAKKNNKAGDKPAPELYPAAPHACPHAKCSRGADEDGSCESFRGHNPPNRRLTPATRPRLTAGDGWSPGLTGLRQAHRVPFLSAIGNHRRSIRAARF